MYRKRGCKLALKFAGKIHCSALSVGVHIQERPRLGDALVCERVAEKLGTCRPPKSHGIVNQ